MPAVNLRRRASPFGLKDQNSEQINGFHVHSGPPKGLLKADTDGSARDHSFTPRVVQMNPSLIRQWLRGSDVERLEQVVLEGQGHKLLGEYSPDPKVRSFLKSVPAYMAKISELHEAVDKGNLNRLKSLLSSDNATLKNIVLCKDLTGAGLLHKAVYKDHAGIVEWLAENHPKTVRLKDREGKTALHYCGASSDKERFWHELVRAGANPNVVDSRGRTAAFYMEKPSAIEMPEARPPSGNLKRFASGKDGGLIVKPSNIRIWIHDKDLARLQQVLWEGYGNKLRTETSSHPRVKRFLDGIPYAMNAIKDVHAAVVNDDYDEFVKKTSEPVPVEILGSKDSNGLNPLHKACGLGRGKMAEDILERNPKLILSRDHDGRTPLHYAAWLKKNDYLYSYLVDNGADEMAFDNTGKLPAYYKANPKEPLGKLLSVIPDAPRTSVTFPPSWDWGILQASARSSLNIPQLVSTSVPVMEPERKSRSDYNLNSLRPPDDLKPDFLYENNEATKAARRTVQEVEERVVKVEEKLFEPEPGEHDSDMEVVGVAQIGEEEPPSVVPNGDGDGEDKGDGESAYLSTEEQGGQTAVSAVVNHLDYIPQQSISLWPKGERQENGREGRDEERDVEESEQEAPAAEEVKSEEIGKEDSSSPQPADDESSNESNSGQEAEPDDTQASSTEKPSDEEVMDEKTEREIAEERQRLMDEGLLKVEDEEEEESDNEREVNEIIHKGDMQGLASMVLEGEGGRLLGKKSSNPEIQGFLDNVPSYIAKIEAVHKAARSGELRDLQAALDRRRFAAAKDGSSALGASPLHVAVLFGRTPIIKYLGGRFPETLNVKDRKGRTPLHYAASLADNNHYFNILLNLGADRKAKDDLGHIPSYYLENPGELTPDMLLKELNSPPRAAGGTSSDKVEEDAVSSRRVLQDPECIAMLNQCYEVVESARGRGSRLPLVTALDVETFHKIKLRITGNDKSLLDVIWPGVRMLRDGTPGEIVEYSDGEKWDDPGYDPYDALEDLLAPLMKNLHCLGSKLPLLQMAKPASPGLHVSASDADFENGGIIAPDFESYKVFEELMLRVVMEIQGVEEIENQPESDFFRKEAGGGGVGTDADWKGRGGIVRRTRKKVGKIMRHFKNEVTPLGSEVLDRRGCRGVVKTVKTKVNQLMGASEERAYSDNKVEPYKRAGKGRTTAAGANSHKDTKVNILIVDPDEKEVEATVEGGESEDEGKRKRLLSAVKDKVNRVVRDLSAVPGSNNPQSNPRCGLWEAEEFPGLEIINLDPTGKYVKFAKVECTRNLDKYQFPLVLGEEELEMVETQLKSALRYQSIMGAEKGVSAGRGGPEVDGYHSVADILAGKSNATALLSANDLLVPLPDTAGSQHCRLLHGNFWPKHRGVHISPDGNLAAWINVQEHLRIVACTGSDAPGHLGEAYGRLARLVASLDKHVKPLRSDALGFVTSRPACLGNALRCHVLVSLPQLATEGRGLLEEFCRKHSLSSSPTRESSIAFRLRNRRCLGATEYSTYHSFAGSVVSLIELERSLGRERSIQVARLIRGILGSQRMAEEEGLGVVEKSL